jgi:2-polyprenyl-3-methyl-5-hydroxy-6-metoxy-1,4-benzoquinol methylase
MNKMNRRRERSAALWEAYNTSRVAFGEELARILATQSGFTSWANARVLDVGCGAGQIARAFVAQGAQVTAFEPNHENAVDVKRRLVNEFMDGRLCVLAADGHELPFVDNAFDVVILSDVLEHVKKPERVAQEVARVLRSGGLLYASMPNRYSILNLISDPHYQVPGVGLMPRWMAAWYVVKLLRITDGYRTEKYFTQGEVVKLLGRVGMSCEELKGQYERRIRSGEMSKSPSRQWINWMLQFPAIRQFALYSTRTVWFRYFLQPGWEFLGFKYDGSSAQPVAGRSELPGKRDFE